MLVKLDLAFVMVFAAVAAAVVHVNDRAPPPVHVYVTGTFSRGGVYCGRVLN